MKTITLTKAWTYRTPERTIDYEPGEHEVTNAIAEAHEAEMKDTTDGDGPATAATPRAPRKA